MLCHALNIAWTGRCSMVDPELEQGGLLERRDELHRAIVESPVLEEELLNDADPAPVGARRSWSGKPHSPRRELSARHT